MKKIRHIIAERLFAPKKCCEGQNQRAIAFKHAIVSSSSTERLNADIAAKAAQALGQSIGQSGTGSKATYEDTDNRKRDFGGDLPPGLEGGNGLVYDPNADGTDPDSVLRLFVSPTSRKTNEIKQQINFGWVKNPKNQTQKPKKEKPQIVIKKYKVNPKTDDIIPSSEKIINPFSTFTGEEFKDNSIVEPENTRALDSQISVKMLPGRSLSSRIPGGSLLGRAAAAIGIIRDANNKFRCPPGTPAANQFTDMYGTTCFGASPTRMARFIHDKAVEVTDAGQMQGFTRFVRRASRWLETGSWDDNQGISALPVNRAVSYMIPGARTVGFDPSTGRSIAPDWSDIDVPSDMRVFKNTMTNAQRRMKGAKDTVDKLAKSLGVDTSETAKATNQDLEQTFQELRNRGMWNIQLGRMSPDEVDEMVRERIEEIDSVRDVKLTPKQKEMLVKADIQRYYVTERAILTTQLEQFTRMPEHMSRVRQIVTGRYVGDGSDADEAYSSFVENRDGSVSPNMGFNIDQIMKNQEAKLPNLGTNERLLIAATGGSSDAERMSEVADFMSRADIHANHMAGLAGGIEGMARHIALHEIAHTIQGQAFVDAVQNAINTEGSFKFQVPGKKIREVKNIRELTSSDIYFLMHTQNPGMTKEGLENLARLNNTWGSYPMEQYFSLGDSLVSKTRIREFGTGTERGVLEAQVELWALREGGFIGGDDIDFALGYMDEYSDARRAMERSSASDAYIKSIERGEFRPSPSAGMAGEIPDGADAPEEKTPSSPADLPVEARRQMLKDITKALRDEDVTEEDMVDFAANAQVQSEMASGQAKELSSEIANLKKELSKFDPEDKKANPIIEQLEDKENMLSKAVQNKEFYDEMVNRARNEWKKKYGIGTRGETARFNEMVYDHRKATGKLSDAEKAKIVADAKAKFFSEEAKKLSKDDLVNEITALETKYAKGVWEGPDELAEVDQKHEALVNEYIDRAIDLGDTRTRNQIRKELINRIEEKVSPKPKPVKKFKSSKDAKDHAMSERKKLRKKITKEQAEAVREMADFDSRDIAQILKPENNASSGRAMNRANARLKRLGLEHDSKSTSEGSMEEQVANILVPTLEAMEVSSVSEPFEFEAVIDVDPGQLTGRSIGKDFDHRHFVSGKVMGKGHKKAEVSKKSDPRTGKIQRRVIVSVKEGDRGLFPTAKGEDKQSFVIPPGKMRIVGRDKDGTIRVEISAQKGTTEVLDDLASDIAGGAGDAIWRKSASRKVKAISDKRVIEKPERLSSGRSVDSSERSAVSKSVSEKLKMSGSSFGEYSKERDDSRDPRSPNFSSGTMPRRETPEERERREILDSASRSIAEAVSQSQGLSRPLVERRRLAPGEQEPKLGAPRNVFESLKNPFNDGSDIDKDDLDPRVRELIDTKSTEELEKIVERTAIKFHLDMDKRPRVRMRESELDEFAETGKIRATRNTGSSVVPGLSRRAERLSSGASPISRSDREKAFAKKVRERLESKLSKIPPPQLEDGMSYAQRNEAIRRHVDNWFDGLSDAELDSMGIRRLYDADNKPLISKTTGRVVYQAENAEVAASLLSLGQTAEMPAHKRGESAMVKQAGKQIKKELKELANTNPGVIVTADLCKFYVEGKNIFCSRNLKVDRLEMPQVGGRAVDNNSMALRMWGSGLATAETAQAHVAGEEGKLTMGLKAQVERLKAEGKNAEAKELEADIKALEFIGLGFEGAGVEQKDITPEQQRVMDKYGLKITGRELKRLGEKWNRIATARMEGKDPDPSDDFTDEERKNFFNHIDYSMLEPDGVDAFTDFLKLLGVGIQEDRVTKPDELMASQRELDGPKVDAISENIVDAVKRVTEIKDPAERKKEIERLRRESGLFKKILISKEGYIVDGHHRIIGKTVANDVVTEDVDGISPDDLDILGLPIRQVDMGIIELLTLSRVYQDFLGIKAASLSAFDDDSFKTAGVIGRASGRIVPDEEDMHGIDKIPKITKEQFDAAHANLLYQLEEKTDEIYERGTFIQVDSIGLNDTEESQIYKAAELRRQEQAASRQRTRRESRQRTRRESRQSEGRLSSGASKPKDVQSPKNIQRIDKTLKNTNIDDESREKLLFALSKIPEYKKGSTRQELNDFAEKLKYVSGETITKLALDQMEEFGLINAYEKGNIDVNLSANDYDGMAQKASAVKNAFFDGSDTLSDIWSPDSGDTRSGRTSGSSYSERKFGPDELDFYENAESSLSSVRRNFWKNAGISDDIDEETLPVSGYMVNKGHINKKKQAAIAAGANNIDDDAAFELMDNDIVGDGLTAQGEIEIVLRPEVAERTAYGKGNALKSGHKPVLVNSSSRSDIVQALTNTKNGKDKEAIINMLTASIDGDTSSVASKRRNGSKFKQVGQLNSKDFDNDPIQAHILGGFDKDEVESINYPFSKIQKLAENENIDDVLGEKSIADALRKAGFTDAEINYFYSMSGGKPLTTQSIQALKTYRAAQKVKEKYKKQGFDNVKFAHPSGINIDNPKTYGIGSGGNQSVEQILKNNIAKEIAEEAKKEIRKMKKNSNLDLIAPSGKQK